MLEAEIPGFTKLSETISIYRPAQTKKLNDGMSLLSPSLVVLCTWMGAASKHITKYTNGYQKIYPHYTTLIVVRTSLHGMFSGFDLTPARDMILEVARNKFDGGSIVLHAFSNGGAITSIRLRKSLIEMLPGRPIFDKVVLDCCPGTADLESATRAITFSLPTHPLIRRVGSWIIWLALISYMMFHEVLQMENSINRMRRQLNEAAMFPLNIPRLYLYSKADRLVGWRDVHTHIEDAMQLGYLHVREISFDEAPHCALLQENPERYWKSVNAHITGARLETS